MKPIIYKTLKSVPPVVMVFLFIAFYFPGILNLSMEFNIVEGSLLFSYSAMILILLLVEKSYWDSYCNVLPIHRKIFVNVPFLLIICSNIIQFVLSVTFYIIGAVNIGDGVRFEYIAKLFACSFISSACIGIILIVIFKFSYKAVYVCLGILYCFFGFCLGFFDGYTESNPSGIAFLNSGRLYVVTAVVCAILFVLEWFISCKIYSKKEL